MTNNELLHASLLDILFDGRNKEYGAYALRRNYNQRMLLALGLGLSFILLFIFINLMMKSNNSNGSLKPDEGYIVLQVATDPETPKEKEKPKDQPKPKEQPPQPAEATIKNTTPVLIDNDNLRTEVPDISDLANHKTGLENIDAPKGDGTLQPPPAQTTGNGTGEKPAIIEEPMKPSSPPQFPGGFEALRKFLYRHLTPPDQLGLEAGEKKIVKVRFTVSKDGSVSLIEVIESAGNIFDKEVIRVCKKMPAWKPAIQNGEPVTTSYVLPVTFISEEQ